MNNFVTPSQELLKGRRALEGMEGVTFIEDWLWHEQRNQWSLRCQLTLPSDGSEFVPRITNWYVFVDATYPWGSIKFYPARKESINHTFPHQTYNFEVKDIQWRTGDLCLDTSVAILGRQEYNSEPFDAFKRLRWHFDRALNWLILASQEKLNNFGDPFELPQFPSLGRKPVLVFAENTLSLDYWSNVDDRVGIVEFGEFQEHFWFVNQFLTLNEEIRYRPSWGKYLRSITLLSTSGIWLLLNELPILQPWQAPITWRELQNVCKTQNFALNAQLKRVLRNFRDGKRHPLLLGFPIPDVIGNSPIQVYWQGILLPVLSNGSQKLSGFRENERGYWFRDQQKFFSGKQPIEWLDTQNWDSAQISTRGQLPQDLASKNVLIIGAGALGSTVAELLVRGGLTNLVLLDHDTLKIGNLVRHTLSLNDLASSKAAALSERLNLISPHAQVQAINKNFPPHIITDSSKVTGCEVIIDCTGSDQLIRELNLFQWGNMQRTFVSLSIGLYAKRLYCFGCQATTFPEEIFRDLIAPWLKRDLDEMGHRKLPREGIGCWHPVFPARIDDIWLLASAAVKQVQTFLKTPFLHPILVTYEQKYENDVFIGINSVRSEVNDDKS
jgi:hypothetical protein